MSALVLAAILRLAPALPPATAERYANDIALACGNSSELCWALVVTAEGESSFLTSRETCETTGDGGKSVTLYQLHQDFGAWQGSTRAELCGSNTLATMRSAEWLSMLRRKTGGWKGALRAYMGARPGAPESVRRIRLFNQLRGVS